MKKILASLALVSGIAPVMAADIGVSINIDQPGAYGRIDIGRVPSHPCFYISSPS